MHEKSLRRRMMSCGPLSLGKVEDLGASEVWIFGPISAGFALVPRYEVRPCMLALYFLGETSKVFRLVKTSKVFARKHRRCFR